MRKFWGFYDNGIYRVGCDGAVCCVYDQTNRKLAKFKDIPYAYSGIFRPKTNIFVLKSTAGLLAIYDLEKLILLKKFRFSEVDYSQDDGFCFSPDGKLFYNLERHITSVHTRMSVYESETFSLTNRYFTTIPSPELSEIEFDTQINQYFVLGFTRNQDGVYDRGFIAVFKEGELEQFQPIGEKEYHFIHSYKTLERSGFTEKSMEWSGLKYAGYTPSEIDAVAKQQIHLAAFQKCAQNFMLRD